MEDLKEELEIHDGDFETKCAGVCRDDCGEAITSQSVVLDFTPNAFDNDVVQLKCVELWELFDSNEELRNLLEITKRNSATNEFTKPGPEYEPRQEHAAISMFELANKKGLFEQVLKQKYPQSHCTIRSVDDFEDIQDVARPDSEKCVCTCNRKVPKHKKRDGDKTRANMK